MSETPNVRISPAVRAQLDDLRAMSWPGDDRRVVPSLLDDQIRLLSRSIAEAKERGLAGAHTLGELQFETVCSADGLRATASVDVRSVLDSIRAAVATVEEAEARREAEQANPLLMYCPPADVERVRAAAAATLRQAVERDLRPPRPVEVHGSRFVPDGQVVVVDPLAARGTVAG
jgi:hypothetical protein